MSERHAGLDLRVQTLRFPGGRRDRVRGPSGRQATTAANAAQVKAVEPSSTNLGKQEAGCDNRR
jgi:hypothetical protein